MRLLLAEDDGLTGDGFKVGLGKMGFAVDWFTKGQSGKKALYTASYDVVLVDDLTLPAIDGLDILREWRLNECYEPMLILTACDALSQRVEGLCLEADDYLCTPFLIAILSATYIVLVITLGGV